jgi:hypothetical protein
MLDVENVVKNSPGAFEIARNYATGMINQYLVTDTQSEYVIIFPYHLL